MLSKITEEGNIKFDINDANIKFCYQKGWIHRVALDGGDDIAILQRNLQGIGWSEIRDDIRDGKEDLRNILPPLPLSPRNVSM